MDVIVTGGSGFIGQHLVNRLEHDGIKVISLGRKDGDIAKKDINGNYFYIGREKDSVRVRGENISAWEIETTLNKKEFISESTILKTKAEIGENDIIALIIPKTNIH